MFIACPSYFEVCATPKTAAKMGGLEAKSPSATSTSMQMKSSLYVHCFIATADRNAY